MTRLTLNVGVRLQVGDPDTNGSLIIYKPEEGEETTLFIKYLLLFIKYNPPSGHVHNRHPSHHHPSS